jgi:predicted nucleic acid-binding protein
MLDAAATGRLHLCAPETVRAEVARVLTRVLAFSRDQLDTAFEALKAEWIPEAIYCDHLPEALAAIRDADDAPILACAMAIGCDIVSGGGDLHALRTKQVKVWRPSDLAGKSP